MPERDRRLCWGSYMINGARRRLWVPIALLIITVGIVSLWPALVTWIFEPMAWLAWAGWRVLAAVDQGVCWAILVVVCAALVFRLALVMPGSPDEEHAQAAVGSAREDRLVHWQMLARRAESGAEGRREFLASLRLLASSVSELTRTHPPRPAMDGTGGGPRAWLTGLLPGRRRISERAAIEELLAGMEAALEITDERHSE